MNGDVAFIPKKHTANKKGLAFEKMIMTRLDRYNRDNKAYGIKIPNDWVIKRTGMKITSASPKAKAFLDFIVFLPKGKVVVVEAKSTANKTSFGLDYIKPHQYTTAIEIGKYCKNVYYIILFRELGRIFFVKAKDVEEFRQNETRKSIPLKWFEDNSEELDINKLDFLEVID